MSIIEYITVMITFNSTIAMRYIKAGMSHTFCCPFLQDSQTRRTLIFPFQRFSFVAPLVPFFQLLVYFHSTLIFLFKCNKSFTDAITGVAVLSNSIQVHFSECILRVCNLLIWGLPVFLGKACNNVCRSQKSGDGLYYPYNLWKPEVGGPSPNPVERFPISH